MNPEIKTKWLEALRSGEYRQGRGYLKQRATEFDKPRHCCLGVLSEIAVAEGVDIKVTKFEGPDDYVRWEYDGIDEVLPDSVMNWAGMDSHIGTRVDSALNLADLNDGGKSFDEWADIIEQEF